MMAADYRHIGGRENRLGRHYSRFSPFLPAPALASQSLALRKLCDAGSNRRRRAKLLGRRRTKLARRNRPLAIQFRQMEGQLLSAIRREPARNTVVNRRLRALDWRALPLLRAARRRPTSAGDRRSRRRTS